MTTSSFVSGIELSGRLYYDEVRPLLSQHFPGLAHTATLIGTGSEVLGFDTARSMDHEWGARLQLFLRADDLARHGDKISNLFAERLPATIAGYPTSLVRFCDNGSRHMRHTTGPVQHGVLVAELGAWLTGRLGFNPLVEITTLDWLATPTQTLAEVTAGAVFHDGLTRLHRVRRTLAWYPDDVWRFVLACQWQRISQEEPFVGRCGEVGDELGSAVVAARLVRDLMRLCLLINRCYPPYSKWLGSSFTRLPCAAALEAPLTGALTAPGWREREQHLVTAYEFVAGLQNDLGLAEPVDAHVQTFHERPFRVLRAERFTTALVKSINDEVVRGLPLTGAIDQFVDSTDALTHCERSRCLSGALYSRRR